MSTSIRAEQQIEFSPYTHHLEEFLSFLKKERGFADATIVNRTFPDPFSGMAGRTMHTTVRRFARCDYQLLQRRRGVQVEAD